jgi:hypothetical protein
MWDEEDGFYYDLLRLRMAARHGSRCARWWDFFLLCATIDVEASMRERIPRVMAHINERLRRMPELSKTMHPTGPGHFGVAERGIMALVNPDRLRRILAKMLDESEFLGPYGVRSLSKFHEQHPYIFHTHGHEFRVDYLPAESNTGMFGGNSTGEGRSGCPSMCSLSEHC